MKKMQFLLILFLPLFVQILGSTLDKGDMELLDMIFRDGDDSDISRSQRDVPQTATSISCDENSSEENYPLFIDEESEEDCPDLFPSIEHPCFMRIILLRTPLHKHDPCANFSIATKRAKSKKCVKKTKFEINKEIPNERNTSISTTQPTTTTSTNIEIPVKTPPTVAMTLGIINTIETTTTTSKEDYTTIYDSTTTEDSTTTDDSTNSSEEDFTTTTDSPTTLHSTTTSSTSTNRNPNQLKSLRNRRRHRKSKKPRVPDPPKIKLDGATQPSEVIQVIFTTEVGELRRENTTTTTTIQPETSTEMIKETTTTEVEKTTQNMEIDVEKKQTTETEATTTEDPLSTSEEPCDDTDEQDTNLCPQFMTPLEENAPPQRYRKPVKNYVEPILYEGHFSKPRQRIGLMTQTVPQQKDYFFTNKQIMPKPKPKYRKRLPPSIYMNNIVRGLKCIDLPPDLRNRNSAPLQPNQHFWGGKRMIPRTFAPTPSYHHQQRYRVTGTPSPPSSQSPDPFSVPVPLYLQHNESEEDFRQDKHHVHPELSYFETDKSDSWQTNKFGSSNTNVDPCELEHEHLKHRQQRERIQHQSKPQDQDEREDHQMDDYGQQEMAANFFT